MDFSDTINYFWNIELPQLAPVAYDSNVLPAKKGSDEFNKRLADSERMAVKYPDRCPIIVVVHHPLRIDNTKFLMPRDLTMSQALWAIKKRILPKTEAAQSLYCLVGNTAMKPGERVGHVYDRKKSNDGMLYLYVYQENTFG